MCNPAAAALALTIFSTGATMYAQQQQNKAQQAQAAHQAAQQRAMADAQREQAIHTLKNADKFEKAKGDSIEEGKRQKAHFIRQAKAMRADKMQDIAGRGVFVDSATALDEFELFDELVQLDADVLYDNYEKQALGFAQQADDTRFQSEQLLKGANQRMLNAGFYDHQASKNNNAALFATAVGGAASATGQYANFKAAGMFEKDTAATGDSAMTEFSPAAHRYFNDHDLRSSQVFGR